MVKVLKKLISDLKIHVLFFQITKIIHNAGQPHVFVSSDIIDANLIKIIY